MTEKALSNSIIAYINRQPGCFAFKRLSSGSTSTNGFPDITGSWRVVYRHLEFAVRLEIEVKRPGCTPDPIQYAQLRKFRDLGMMAFWTDSLKDCRSKLELWSGVAAGEICHPGNSDIISPDIHVFGKTNKTNQISKKSA